MTYDTRMETDNEHMLALTRQEPLRVCRKCGRQPTFFRNAIWWKGPPEEREPYAVRYRVSCKYCGNTAPSLGSPERAMYEWQRRNDPSAPPKRLAVWSRRPIKINYGYVVFYGMVALFLFGLIYHFMVA